MLFAGLSQGCSMIAGQGPVPEVLAPEGALTTLNNFLVPACRNCWLHLRDQPANGDRATGFEGELAHLALETSDLAAPGFSVHAKVPAASG